MLDQLEGVLKRTFARGGVLLIPAFAVGRAQQMIWLMDELVTQGRMRPFPIHVDSPMAIDATRIYAAHPEAQQVDPQQHRRPQPAARQVDARCTARAPSREALNDMKGPAVIISSSGMLSGGRILHHCRVRLPHPENTLLITGYQAAGTLGRALLDGAHVVRIHKGDVPVLAEVRDLKGLSGHADAARDDALAVVGVAKPPRAVFVTHGEEDAALALAARIGASAASTLRVPALGETVELELAPAGPAGRGQMASVHAVSSSTSTGSSCATTRRCPGRPSSCVAARDARCASSS